MRNTKRCIRCREARPKSARSIRCLACHRAVRRIQLRRNNRIWAARVSSGEASHRYVYDGKPTRWAQMLARRANRRKAHMAGRITSKKAISAKKLTAPKSRKAKKKSTRKAA